MNHRKGFFAGFAVLILLVAMLAGCSKGSSSMSYSFSVENGDAIKVSLDTSDGYRLTGNLPFEIFCEDALQSQGTFIRSQAYAQYVEAVEADENATLLDSGEKDGNAYIFWCYNGTEFNYAICIANSDTGVILGNAVSEESARDCFERLTITVKEQAAQ